MDTQMIRNAYMGRDVTQLDLPFGMFAASYLGVKDRELEHMFNLNEACNYILMMGYNSNVNLGLPQVPEV